MKERGTFSLPQSGRSSTASNDLADTKPRIVLTSRLATTQPGGIESAVRELANRIASSRPDWIVRCVHAFERPSRLNHIPFVGDLVAAVLIAMRCRKADVVLTNGAEYAWPRMVTDRGRARTIVVWHGTRAGEIPALVPRMGIAVRAYLWLEIALQRIALRARCQIAVSESTVFELQQTYGAKAHVVPNGATPLTPCEQVTERAEEIVWLGTTPYKKGLDLAVETCRLLRTDHPKLRLTVVGLTRIEMYADEWWIEWTGPLDHAATLAHVGRSAIFLGTTRYEGCSVAVIEALALGVPIIASPVIAWMVPNGEGGVAVADATPESFADAARSVLDNEGLRASLSERAIRRSAAFDWAAAANAYVAEIESVLGEN